MLIGHSLNLLGNHRLVLYQVDQALYENAYSIAALLYFLD